MQLENVLSIIKKPFIILLLAGLYSTTTNAQVIVTKTFTDATSVVVDGCGIACEVPGIPPVTFTASDFPGIVCPVVTDVNVSVRWMKVDGTCASPGAGDNGITEVNFAVEGPDGIVTLINPGTWFGPSTADPSNTPITSGFDQDASSIHGGIASNSTRRPNGGDLDDFVDDNPLGDWRLLPGDTLAGDELCIDQYSITLTI